MRRITLPWRELADTEAEYGGDAESLGDIDLLRIVIKELTPLSDDERRAALDEFDFDAYTRRLIWEELAPRAGNPTPSWQWASELARLKRFEAQKIASP